VSGSSNAAEVEVISNDLNRPEKAHRVLIPEKGEFFSHAVPTTLGPEVAPSNEPAPGVLTHAGNAKGRAHEMTARPKRPAENRMQCFGRKYQRALYARLSLKDVIQAFDAGDVGSGPPTFTSFRTPMQRHLDEAAPEVSNVAVAFKARWCEPQRYLARGVQHSKFCPGSSCSNGRKACARPC